MVKEEDVFAFVEAVLLDPPFVDSTSLSWSRYRKVPPPLLGRSEEESWPCKREMGAMTLWRRST